MGRPRNPPPPPEVLEAILDQLADGVPLKVICRQPGMPNPRRLYELRDIDDEFARDLQLARDCGEEAIAADIIEIADAEPGFSPQGGIDGAEVSNRKLRVWARSQILDRFNPKRRAERETDPNTAVAEMLAQLARSLPG